MPCSASRCSRPAPSRPSGAAPSARSVAALSAQCSAGGCSQQRPRPRATSRSTVTRWPSGVTAAFSRRASSGDRRNSAGCTRPPAAPCAPRSRDRSAVDRHRRREGQRGMRRPARAPAQSRVRVGVPSTAAAPVRARSRASGPGLTPWACGRSVGADDALRVQRARGSEPAEEPRSVAANDRAKERQVQRDPEHDGTPEADREAAGDVGNRLRGRAGRRQAPSDLERCAESTKVAGASAGSRRYGERPRLRAVCRQHRRQPSHNARRAAGRGVSAPAARAGRRPGAQAPDAAVTRSDAGRSDLAQRRRPGRRGAAPRAAAGAAARRAGAAAATPAPRRPARSSAPARAPTAIAAGRHAGGY